MAQQGRINFGVGFQVDKTGLNQLKQSLQEIANLTAKDITIPGLNAEQAKKELRDVQQEALKLEQALQQSYNIKLGTHDGKKFNKLLEDSGTNLDQIKAKLMSAGTAGKKVWTDFSTTFTHVNKELTRTKGLIDRIGETLFNTIKWSIASSAVNAFTGTVQKAFTYVEKLDQSLNDIRIVTNKSANEMAEFAKQANKAAQGLGATTTDYTNASLIYYQQGLSDEEVSARTETTVKVANVTGQSAAEASNQLTAIWNGYKVSAEEAELYIDKVSAVAATTGADLEELSEGMGKVASAANSMGVDIDQLNASLATVITVTREDANAVGTAFKTIYARMGDLAIDGEDEFGIKLGEVSGQMKQMGVDILDTNGQMRQMGEIMEEVAGKWEGWTDAQQRAAAIALAGKRQYNNLIALFENWDMYESAKATSAGGMGTLSEQQKIYDESLEAHMNKLTAAAQGIYDSLFNSESFIEVIDLATDFLGVLEEIVDTLGGGGQVLSTIGGLLVNIFSRKIAVELNNVVNKFIDWRVNSKSLAQSLQNFSILEELKKDTDDVTASAIKLESVATKLYSKGFISEENYKRLQATGAQMAELAKRKATVDKGVKVANNLLGEGAVNWDAISAEGGKSDAAQQARDALAPEEEHLTVLIEGANKYKEVWAEFTEWRSSAAKQIPKAAETQEQLTAQKKEELALLKQKDTLDHAAINRLKAEITLSEKKARTLRKQHANYLEAQEKIKTQSAGITKKDIDMLMKSKAISSQTKSNLQQALEAAQKTNAAPFGEGKSGQIISAEGKAAGQAFIKAYIEALQEGKENVDAAYQAITDKKNVDAGVAEGEAAKEAAEREAARAQAIQSLTQMVGVTMQLNGVINNVFSAFNAFKASDPASVFQSIMGIGLQLVPLLTTSIPLFKTIFSTIKTGFSAAATGAQTLNAALGVIGLALAAISTVMTIVSGVVDAQEKAREAQLEQLKETRDAAKEVVEEGQKLQDLYVNYMNLLAAYEETGQGKEQLITATEELAGAYGTEINVVDELAGNYDKLALSIANYRKQKALEALEAAAEAVDADEQRIAGTKSSTSHELGTDWLAPAVDDYEYEYYKVNRLSVEKQTGTEWHHGLKFDTGMSGEDWVDKDIAALFDEGLKAYFDKEKKYNPFQTYISDETGLLVTYTPKDGTEVQSQWTPEMMKEFAAAAESAMSYAAAGKGHLKTYGTNWFIQGGSDFANSMYGWLDKMDPILSDVETDEKDFSAAIATAAQTLISATDLTEIDSAEDYARVEKELKEQIKKLYDKYGHEYTTEQLDADVKIALGSYDFLKEEAQASAVQEEMKRIGLDASLYANKDTDALRLIGAAIGTFEIDSLDKLQKTTGIENQQDALNALVLAYQAKQGYNAFAAGTLNAIKEKILAGDDVSEDLAVLKMQLPDLAEKLTGFKDKGLQEQLNILADISTEYTEAMQGVQEGKAGMFTPESLGFDTATTKFDVLASEVNSVIYPFEGFAQALEMVDEGLVIAAKDVEEFTKLMPELAKNAVFNADGSMTLDPTNLITVFTNAGITEENVDDMISKIEAAITTTTDDKLRGSYQNLLSSLLLAKSFLPELFKTAGIEFDAAAIQLMQINLLLEKQQTLVGVLEKRYSSLYSASDKLGNLQARLKLAMDIEGKIEDRSKTELAKLQDSLKTDFEDFFNAIAEESPELFTGLQKELENFYLFNNDGSLNTIGITRMSEQITALLEPDSDGSTPTFGFMDDYSNLMTSVSEYNDQFFQFVTELEDAGYSVIELMTEMYNVSLDAINTMTDATIDASNTLREFDLIGGTASMIASFKYDADAAAEAVNALSDSVTSLLSADDNPIQGSNLFERDPEAAKAKAVDYYQSIIDNASKYYDAMTGLQEEWMSKLDEQNELYEATLDYLGKVNGLLEHQLELNELLGESRTGLNEAEVLIAQIVNAQSQATISYESMTSAKKAYDDYMQGLESEGLTLDATDESYRAIAERYAASIETWYASVATAAEVAQEKYLKSIESTFEAFETKMLSMSLDDASTEWDWVTAQNERWLDNVNAAYGLRDLERKFTKTIDQTQSVAMQQKLNQLRETELKALKEKDKLTQYDLDRAAKRLEIMQAEIALQEAQEAKSQMRLVRGADGAYSYQYVADANAIAQAEENLDKLNNELYNLDKEQYLNNLSEIQDMYGSMAEEVRSILEDMTLTEDERMAKVEETLTRYMDEMQALGLGTADIYSVLSETVTSAGDAMNGAFDALSKFSGTGIANLASQFSIKNIDSIKQGLLTNVKEISNAYQTELNTIFSPFEGGYKAALDEAGKALGDISAALKTSVDAIGKINSSEYFEQLSKMYQQWIGPGPNGEPGIATQLSSAVTDLEGTLRELNKLDGSGETGKPDPIADISEDVGAIRDILQPIADELQKDQTRRKEEAEADAKYSLSNEERADLQTKHDQYLDKEITEGEWAQRPGSWQEYSLDQHYKAAILKTQAQLRLWLDSLSGAELLSSSAWTNGSTNAEWGAMWLEELQHDLDAWTLFGEDVSSKQQDAQEALDEVYKYIKFDTGGYTGEWGADGKVAMLHEKELVLNKTDTANILEAVDLVRNFDAQITSRLAHYMEAIDSFFKATSLEMGANDFEQNVHITAEFPNATDKNEIEEAFRDLVNLATQRAFENTRT